MSSTDRLIQIGEAARLLGVSVPTLRAWDRSGRLRALRLPGSDRRVYRESELRSFLEALNQACCDDAHPLSCRPHSKLARL